MVLTPSRFVSARVQTEKKNVPDGGGRRLEGSQNLASFYVSFLHILQIPAAIAVATYRRVCRKW